MYMNARIRRMELSGNQPRTTDLRRRAPTRQINIHYLNTRDDIKLDNIPISNQSLQLPVHCTVPNLVAPRPRQTRIIEQ